MGNSVQELIDMLYAMIEDAWQAPLGARRCIIEKDKVLDILDEIRRQLPTELAEAQRLVSTRAEFVGNAKREAEAVKKKAEEVARQMIDREEVVRAAKSKASTIVSDAENQAAELRRVANAYTDDLLRRTEEAINEAMGQVRTARSRFKTAAPNVSAPRSSMPLGDEDPIE